MKVENWCGYDIRFIEIDGEWYAILKDICNALDLSETDIADFVDEGFVDVHDDTQILNENGIYAAIFLSDHPRARTTRNWLAKLLRKHGNGLLDECPL